MLFLICPNHIEFEIKNSPADGGVFYCIIMDRTLQQFLKLLYLIPPAIHIAQIFLQFCSVPFITLRQVREMLIIACQFFKGRMANGSLAAQVFLQAVQGWTTILRLAYRLSF